MKETAQTSTQQQVGLNPGALDYENDALTVASQRPTHYSDPHNSTWRDLPRIMTVQRVRCLR